MLETMKRILTMAGKYRHKVTIGIIISLLHSFFSAMDLFAILYISFSINTLTQQKIGVAAAILLVGLTGKITGRNGSGKSAFLRVLCGLMKEKAGRIVFDGKPYPYKKRRELCYMTMQDVVHQLFSDSVWEEFSLLNKTVDEQEITKILRRLDLLDYKDKHPMTLSGGQKQRLALAVATLANKDIMIFDEPTSGLDYGNMIKVCELIKELSSNRIVFVATHDRELMGLLCTRRMEISNESISVYDLTAK